ncbi:MAG: NAD(P)H-hydrate dehydratase [Bacteroidetes bacterium]|nr:NAD(P)H-hydrate dehydratase [Bacteroidota bacterium]
MIRIVTAQEMRWCDETTISKGGIPGILLMEHAGAGVAEFVRQKYAPLSSKHLVVCCGKGNNAGDGFVVARILSQECAHITVVLIAPPSALKGDAKTNLEILKMSSKSFSKNISFVQASQRTLKKISKPDVIVDAIFGTGFSGEVGQKYASVIQWINSCKVPVVAVDIPSGVHGTTGRASNPAVHASATVTFGFLKTGLLCNEGREFSGERHVVDIGIPRSIGKHLSLKYSVIENDDVASRLPKRSIFAHKYSVGKVYVLGGSRGLTGAAALCSLSAFRSGAGAVVLGTPETVYPILAKKLTEVMTQPLPATSIGTVHSDALEVILKKASWADVVLLGPGLGQHPETQKLIIQFLSLYNGKVVLDADALNALAASDKKRIHSQAEIIITPHVGEFSRLSGILSNDIETNRLQVAQEYSQKNRITLVLKGVPTVTAHYSGEVVMNSTGNPGMATAGAGDVLAGLIAGLWAQGMSAFEAASCGVYLHGAAGDLAAKSIGMRSMLATDILKMIPKTLQSIERK